MRFLHKIYANLFGYFWLPCPVCGKHFGGHEHVWTTALITKNADGSERAQGVCSYECGDKAKEINKANGYYWPI